MIIMNKRERKTGNVFEYKKSSGDLCKIFNNTNYRNKEKNVNEVIKMYLVVKLCKMKHRLWSFNYS